MHALIAQLKEKMSMLAAQMTALMEKPKAENRRPTNEELTQWDNMLKDYESLEGEKTRAEKTDTINSNLAQVPRDRILDQFGAHNPDIKAKQNARTPHDNAFGAYLRHGIAGLGTDQLQLLVTGPQEILNAAQATTPGAAGGYVVPTGFQAELEKAEKWFGGIDEAVRVLSTATGNPLPWPSINDVNNRGRMIGQNVQVTNTGLTFGQPVTFGAYIGCSDLVLIPLALLQDSAFDLDSLAASLLGERLGRLKNYECTVGGGINEPTGIVTAAVAAGLTQTFAAGSVTGVTYDDLIDLEFKVDPAYRDEAKYMFPDAILKALRKLKDLDNRPLWMPALSGSLQLNGGTVTGFRPTINNHSYIVNNDMPTPAAGSNSILFGDLKKFVYREVKDVTVMVLRERYADYLQVGYLAFRRFDSNLVDAGTHPVAVGVQAAA